MWLSALWVTAFGLGLGLVLSLGFAALCFFEMTLVGLILDLFDWFCSFSNFVFEFLRKNLLLRNDLNFMWVL